MSMSMYTWLLLVCSTEKSPNPVLVCSCCHFEVKKWRSTGAILSFLGKRIDLIVQFGEALSHDFMPDTPALHITQFTIQSALKGLYTTYRFTSLQFHILLEITRRRLQK